MSHNSGWAANLGKKSISESKFFFPNDNEGDVGGLNCTFHPMKPLITMYILNLG
jgi:hypothetical protein